MIVRYEMGAIVITDTKLFNRTGAIGLWAERVESRFTANAIAKAPSGADSGRVNKSRANAAYPVGSLKAGISGGVRRIGPRQLQTIVQSSAPYSLFVIKGTGMIFSTSARDSGGRFTPLEGAGLYIPSNPGWGKSQMRQRVRGQAPNNFLGAAFDATARTHSSLRGYSIVGTF